MDNTALYVWSETVPNWIMAVAAAAAAVVFLWRRRDKAEQRALRTEELGAKVHARWVILTGEDPAKPRWGVLVTNGLETPIRDVIVECQGNRHSNTFSHAQLAPGNQFFESRSDRGRPWGFAQAVSVSEIVDNVTPGNYDVHRLWFTARGRRYVRNSDGTVVLEETRAG